jgi:hypothetical protein
VMDEEDFNGVWRDPIEYLAGISAKGHNAHARTLRRSARALRPSRYARDDGHGFAARRLERAQGDGLRANRKFHRDREAPLR